MAKSFTRGYYIYDMAVENISKSLEGTAESKQIYVDSFESTKESFYRSLKIKEMFLLNNSDEKLVIGLKNYFQKYHEEQVGCTSEEIVFPVALFNKGCSELGVEFSQENYTTVEEDTKILSILAAHPILTAKLALNILNLGKFRELGQRPCHESDEELETEPFNIKTEPNADHKLHDEQISDEESDTGYHSASSQFLSS